MLAFRLVFLSSLIAISTVINAESPATQPVAATAEPVIDGRAAYRDLSAKYAAMKDADGGSRSIESYEKIKHDWKAMCDSLRQEQWKALIQYASTAKFTDDEFDTRLEKAIVVKAVNDADVETLKKLLANSMADDIDGKYIEWAIEQKTGKAVEILVTAYQNASSVHQSERIAAVFRRAFGQIDGDRLNDEEFIWKCSQFFAMHMRWHADLYLNDHYRRPVPEQLNALTRNFEHARQTPAPDPDSGLLFRE